MSHKDIVPLQALHVGYDDPGALYRAQQQSASFDAVPIQAGALTPPCKTSRASPFRSFSVSSDRLCRGQQRAQRCPRTKPGPRQSESSPGIVPGAVFVLMNEICHGRPGKTISLTPTKCWIASGPNTSTVTMVTWQTPVLSREDTPHIQCKAKPKHGKISAATAYGNRSKPLESVS